MSMGAFRAYVTGRAQTIIQGLGAEWAGVVVKPGKIDGPVDQFVACCYPVADRERANVLEREYMVNVRLLLPAQNRSADPYTPFDPALLETLAMELAEGFMADQSAGGAVWLLRPTQSAYDPDTPGVEVQVMAIGRNPFEVV